MVSGIHWLRSKEVLLALATVAVLVIANQLDSQHTYWINPGESAVDIVRQVAQLGIATLGVTVVILAGGIDLSVGSMIALSAAVCGSIMMVLRPEIMSGSAPMIDGHYPDLPTWVIATAVAGSLVVGLLVGTLHAWLIVRIGLPPFIATLATLVGLRSLARLIIVTVYKTVLGSDGQHIFFTDPGFLQLKAVSIRMWFFALATLAVWFLLRKTVVGRHIYALGGNEQATRLSGISVGNVKWLAYCLCAVLAAAAGVFHAAEISTVQPELDGQSEELNAIAAAVVGGCSLQGGIGSVPGAVLGVVFIRCVLDGIAKVIKSDAEIYTGLVVGIVVAMAVALSQARSGGTRFFQVFEGGLGLAAIAVLTALAGLGGVVFWGPKGGTATILAVGVLLIAIRSLAATRRT
jgi:ribose/xylose/arabinose/galactoside ABC-type transport system permease subunit